MPHKRYGRSLRFVVSEVDAWLQRGTRRAGGRVRASSAAPTATARAHGACAAVRAIAPCADFPGARRRAVRRRPRAAPARVTLDRFVADTWAPQRGADLKPATRVFYARRDFAAARDAGSDRRAAPVRLRHTFAEPAACRRARDPLRRRAARPRSRAGATNLRARDRGLSRPAGHRRRRRDSGLPAVLAPSGHARDQLLA